MFDPVAYLQLTMSTLQERYKYYICNDLKFPYLMIGSMYPFLLLIACFILAIKIRKVPSGFNEARYIGLAVYTTIVIWLVRVR